TLDLSADAIYMTIPAGSSIAVNHTALGPLYDFATFGTGTFSFAPVTTFQTGPDHAPLQVATDAVAVQVTHDVAKRALVPGLERRLSTPTCADSRRLQILTDSLSYARSLAGGAATDIRSHPNGPEYTSYFAGNSQDDIWFNMDRIAGDLASSGTRRCIYTCDYFFTSVGSTPGICTGGYDVTQSSRGGVLLHEVRAHMCGGICFLI
ncbi:hypothetical protein B0H17DRAFT_953566, partial [Mycena rosella]